LDWGCGHINVEFSGQTYTVLYLYKYLFKGPSKVAVTLEQANQANPVLELHKHDEVGRYLRGRRLCSMDAMWRLMGFQTYPASDPPVIGVKVRSPDFMEEYTARHKLCDLVVYFARPATAELSPMTFKDFFCNYTVMRTEPKTGTRFQLHELNAPMFGTKNVYIRKREKPVLCRLHSVSHASGDL
jgi:hypothetical protein